ncbi:RagB/SusD family nutrient uptake outer membrane protein [Flavivirga rizhaonensis]|uniref:RagB/SusD family nutrient uptake outer membrane protein n=1 Tax=Flavivirga rizhaonensis TaxID=2559571 RepID=A0A4S1DV45_9FLAO|nr:RagB/SusD family nutrient uptake outer membrane protein [Flavivirga rizhaonensis]TGV01302.1 RagB/SusD family nutrient uptake outer membrane protein [Flavivirga rizhaonensis]
MNIKIKRIGLLITIVLVGTLVACSDNFLVDTNNQDLTSEVVFSSDDTALAAVTGVYDAFQNDSQGDPGIPNEYNVKGIHRWANSTGLDFLNNENPATSSYLNFNPDPSSSDVAVKIWPNHYRQIGRANITLEGLRTAVENGSINTDLGNRLIGEVLVLRCISYQYLCEVYGDVPLMLSPADDPFKARDSQDMVFQQIVTDAIEAITLLPWTYDVEKGRITKATAYTVLGNAHMWLKQYGEAVTAYEALEDSPVLDLEDNFLDIHALANPNGKESIFELQWAANADLSWGRNDEVNILQLFAMPTDITGGGGFTGIPSKELYDAFEPGDLRRSATVLAPGEEHPDPLIDIINYDGVDINTVGTVAEPWTGGSPETRSGYWAVKSWRDPEIEGWGRSILFGGQGHIWMRYGGALLSLAEAALKDGQTAKAQAAFDRVRNRAWGGTAPNKTVDMDGILKEYRLELAGEFSLWGVIRRSGEANKFIMDNYGLDMPANREIYPIPSSQLSANPNLKQNDGY